MSKNRKNRRAGFTLVELLLVITILGILGTVVVVNFGDVGGRARAETTRQSIAAIAQACEMYRVQVGRGYPKSLEDLTVGINDEEPLLKSSDLNDGWGAPFEYKTENGNRKYSLRSAGPDGQMNTEDDITN